MTDKKFFEVYHSLRVQKPKKSKKSKKEKLVNPLRGLNSIKNSSSHKLPNPLNIDDEKYMANSAHERNYRCYKV